MWPVQATQQAKPANPRCGRCEARGQAFHRHSPMVSRKGCGGGSLTSARCDERLRAGRVFGRLAGGQLLTFLQRHDAGQDRLPPGPEPKLGAHVTGGTRVAVGDLLVASRGSCILPEAHQAGCRPGLRPAAAHPGQTVRRDRKGRFIAVCHPVVQHADVVRASADCDRSGTHRGTA